MSLYISQLWHYPLKSAQGVALSSADLYAHGLAQDRRWLLADASGQMLTQRQHPKLGALQVDVIESGLRLTWEHQSIIAQPIAAQSRLVQVWADQLPAYAVADAVNQQLSAWLGQTVALVYCPDQATRAVDRDYAGDGFYTAFSDGFPLLLLTQASLDALSDAWGQLLDVRRFRPNIVVAGDCAAFAEDDWRSVQVGGLVFDLVKPCSRCVIPSLDPERQQPTQGFSKFLASQRRRADGKVYLGQNAILRQSQHIADFSTRLGQLNIGDIVTPKTA